MIKPSVLCDFVDYVESFYGAGGIYDHELGFHVTRERIWSATSAHLMSLMAEGSDFEGDTVDREMVRDVMIEQHREGVRV